MVSLSIIPSILLLLENCRLQNFPNFISFKMLRHEIHESAHKSVIRRIAIGLHPQYKIISFFTFLVHTNLSSVITDQFTPLVLFIFPFKLWYLLPGRDVAVSLTNKTSLPSPIHHNIWINLQSKMWFTCILKRYYDKEYV